ncbi:MAG: VanW family protein [Anaerolineaceae bacterium]|nr:VanW family protein [Anaerolineaceae bacterium]
MSAISFPSSSSEKPFLLQVLRAIMLGMLLFFLAAGLLLATFEMMYSGRIYSGVSLSGVDLSGLTPAEAALRIGRAVDYPQRGRILLHDQTRTWTASPAELGFFVDPETSALAAFQVGRTGLPIARLADQYGAWFNGKSLAPTLVFDQRIAQQYLLTLAKQIDQPVVEAKLGLNGAEVAVHSGQVGRTLDTASALALVTQQLATLRDGAISLPVRETPPVILDASAQAELARRILSAPLMLSLPDPQEGDPGPWSFDTAALASLLTIERISSAQGANYQVALNTDALRTYLADLAPKLQRDPKMPKFTYNDETKKFEVLEHAVIGRSLDIDATIQTINEKVVAGEHTVHLAFQINPPAVTDDATPEQLGITQLVHSETSYFYGSGPSRVQNITIAAKQFHGVLVAPGEVFSMGAHMSDVSLDNGYAEALIIVGNQTITGVGGGVCQVSTTLFRAAFFTGFPIVERHAHAYRVLYYEKIAGNKLNPDFAGMDATVYFPLVDLKFKNDTPYWLLMETYVNPGGTITWKFYSTSDNRTVDYNTTGLTNITPPPDPIYRENPDLPKGTIKQVDWAVQGADVTVHRTVQRNNAVYLQDTFYTHFQPWRDIFEYGPGTENIPTPGPSLTPSP